MADFVVGTYSASLQVLFDTLSSPMLRRFGFLLKVEDKLESLQRTVLGIDSLAFHAEMMHVRDPFLDIWLRALKDAAWDAEDLIDDFAIMVNDIDGENQNQNRYYIIKKAEEMMNRYDIGKKIDEIQNRLATIASERSGLRLAYPPPQPQIQKREWRATSSLPLPSEREVFGRDDDRKNMVRLLLEPSEHVVGALTFPVIPIVGMGGLGKTTLARAVYNDPEVENHFKDLRIWVYVSEDLNVARITEEIFEAACGKKPSSIGSWDILQRELRNELSKKMFLLVLDDVWTENFTLWDRLFAPLNYGKEGSKVVITTRSRKVADIIGTVRPLSLGRLPEPDCWNLFKTRSFVRSSCDEHPGLEKIGRKIVERLGGVPLAVKTIGGLCSSNFDEGDWTAILDNEIWALPQQEDDIMPVLRLSYQQMPAHLKLCFKFCSIFPKGYMFEKYKLVPFWMAHGFVQPRPQERRPIKDIGGEYFDDLVCRSFFQVLSPDFHSMHDLMHDLAQSISAEECVIINDDNKQKIPEKVRHLSLNHDSSFEFEDLYKLKSLRTLAYFGKPSGLNFSHVPRELFENLKYLRVLDLSHSGIVELPDSIGLLKHLRHLDLSWTKIRSLPSEVGDLFNLQTMELRRREALDGLLSKLVGIGNLKSLQKLENFEVSRETGRKVGELKKLTELRVLVISQLENVINEVEAKEASLINKQYLHSLVLEWGPCERENGSDEKVLECLKPHPNLKALVIKCNDGIHFPSWLADQYLANLEKVTLANCRRWKVLPSLGQLSSLKYLRIMGMAGAEKLHPEIMYKGFPSLRHLCIYDCPKLSVLPTLPPTLVVLEIERVGLRALPRLGGCNEISSSASSSTSSPSSNFFDLIIHSCPELTSLREWLLHHHHHHALNYLEIIDCGNLVDLPTEGLSMLISLKSLVIKDCPNLSMPDGDSLPSSLGWLDITGSPFNQLHNLTSLTYLSIKKYPELISLSGEVLRNLTALEYLGISGCEELLTFGIQALNSLKKLLVESCPRLTSLTDSREGLQNFIPLKTIEIRDCASFDHLPAGLHHLSSLEKLVIENCPQIKRSFTDLPASLQIFEIN